MDERRRLASRVIEEGISLSEAARLAGVSRITARKWVQRARVQGLDQVSELSRAPLNVPGRTAEEHEKRLLELKREFPEWGAKKLVVLLDDRTGIRMNVRTADRILERNGQVKRRSPRVEPIRFEREEANDLFQLDFKGLPKSLPYSVLSVLDDAKRFALAFEPLKDKRGNTVFEFLWELFGEHGLPESILMDNGDCWGSASSKAPTRFEVKLMLLGIRPIHGRPGHPQTQGKVERFHETAKTELGGRLLQPDAQSAREIYRAFRNRYNWVRPHEALGMKTPGACYHPERRPRPDRLPEHVIPSGEPRRYVDPEGYISYKNRRYRVGKGLGKERVVITDDEFGPRVVFNGFPIAYLHEL